MYIIRMQTKKKQFIKLSVVLLIGSLSNEELANF